MSDFATVFMMALCIFMMALCIEVYFVRYELHYTTHYILVPCSVTWPGRDRRDIGNRIMQRNHPISILQRNRSIPVLLSALAIVLVLCPRAFAQITVATAANVQFAMEELKAAFHKASGIDVKPVYGSSGKLATQIKNGAPFDVFVSADMDFPDSLHKWGYAPDKAKPYAYGKLVLRTLKDLDLDKGIEILLDSMVSPLNPRYCRLGSPELAHVYYPDIS